MTAPVSAAFPAANRAKNGAGLRSGAGRAQHLRPGLSQNGTIRRCMMPETTELTCDVPTLANSLVALDRPEAGSE